MCPSEIVVLAVKDLFCCAPLVVVQYDFLVGHVPVVGQYAAVCILAVEEEYFFHNIHGDLDRVIRSIREKNQNATESAPIERPASNDKKMQRLLQSMKYKSNPIEEFWRYFCEELQIDYDKLLDDEHDTMKRIFKKSKLLKSFPSHKNKARK